MSQVMELLEKRQGGKSNEQFANEIGLRGSTLWRYYNRKSDINTSARKRMIEYFIAHNDAQMIGALLAYKTGCELTPDDVVRLGECFLSIAKCDMALVPSN